MIIRKNDGWLVFKERPSYDCPACQNGTIWGAEWEEWEEFNEDSRYLIVYKVCPNCPRVIFVAIRQMADWDEYEIRREMAD